MSIWRSTGSLDHLLTPSTMPVTIHTAHASDKRKRNRGTKGGGVDVDDGEFRRLFTQRSTPPPRRLTANVVDLNVHFFPSN